MTDERKHFEELILGKISQGSIDAHDRSFNAALHYEMNCRAKYDFPDNRPSLLIPKGERIDDYAMRYGTTVKEMKDCELRVDQFLGSNDNPPRR